jgi:hypothetical protein
VSMIMSVPGVRVHVYVHVLHFDIHFYRRKT